MIFWSGNNKLQYGNIELPYGNLNYQVTRNKEIPIFHALNGLGRGFATTIGACGITIGHLVLPLIFEAYQKNMGMETILRMVGVLFVALIPAGLLMFPAESSESNPAQKSGQRDRSSSVITVQNTELDLQVNSLELKEFPQLISKTLWKNNPLFIWHLLNFCLSLAAYFGSLTFMPIWFEKIEIPEIDNDKFRLTAQQVLVVAEAIGRVAALFIISKFEKIKILACVYSGLTLGWVIFMIALPVAKASGIYIVYVAMGILGPCTACYAGTLFSLCMDLFPRQKYAVGLAMSNFIAAIFNLIVILVFGKLFNVYKNLPMIISCGFYVLAALTLIPIRKRLDDGKVLEEKIKEKRRSRALSSAGILEGHRAGKLPTAKIAPVVE